jgi:hypothetical protein
MGQAKRRGTLEERMAQSIQNKQKIEEAREAARQLQFKQEIEAYSYMTEEQIGMSEERHEKVMKRRLDAQIAYAQLMGCMYGAFL